MHITMFRIFDTEALSRDVVDVSLFSVLPLSFLTDEARSMSSEVSPSKRFATGLSKLLFKSSLHLLKQNN